MLAGVESFLAEETADLPAQALVADVVDVVTHRAHEEALAERKDEVQRVIDSLAITQEEFDQLLVDAGITDLDAELEAYEYCQDVNFGGDGTCKNYYDSLLDLKSSEQMVGGGLVDSTTGLESDGETPVIMEGSVSPQGITVGPNFETGRRTWTDITAD